MNKNVETIFNQLETIHTLYCSTCGASDYIVGGDEYSAAEDLSDRGWNGTKHGNVYCPKCSAKKLKPKKVKK